MVTKMQDRSHSFRPISDVNTTPSSPPLHRRVVSTSLRQLAVSWQVTAAGKLTRMCCWISPLVI